MKRNYLTPYRRHLEECPHKDKGRNFTLCACPVWVYGRLNERPYRRSLQTSDWSRAERRIQILTDSPENFDAVLPAASPRTIAGAVKSYLADCVQRNLQPTTMRSYTDVLHAFTAFVKDAPLCLLDLDILTGFRDSRQIKPRTQRKEIEYLRAFCAFCVTHKWMTSNPAKSLKPPLVDDIATLPFTEEEIEKLIEACNRMRGMCSDDTPSVRQRARALVWALLYSGLRIGDIAKLRRGQLEKTGHLVLRAEKNGVPVKVLLHADAIRDLQSLPANRGNTTYFFWTGIGKSASITGSLRRTIDRLGKVAGVHAHPHRFRDTFAVQLLTNGSDIRTVQKLLGHESIKTTEKHYAHFVAAHQKILDSATASLDFRPKAARPLLVTPLKRRRRNA